MKSLNRAILLVVTVLSLGLAAPVFADEYEPNGGGPPEFVPPPFNNDGGDASANAEANATATGIGVGVGVGSGHATSSGGTSNVSVDASTNVDAEPAIAPGLAVLVGTQCKGSVSMSGAGGGLISAGIGLTYDDKECNLREAIKLLGSLPQGTTVRGHEVKDLVGEMAVKLTGVEEALAALNPEEDDGSDVLHGDVYEDFNTGPYDR